MAKSYKKEFEIEKKLKNEAYFFIIENRLFDDFREWKEKCQIANEDKTALNVFSQYASELQPKRNPIGFRPTYMDKTT